MGILYYGVIQTVLHFILLYIKYIRTYSTKGLRHKCPPIPCNMGGKAGGELKPQQNDARVDHVTPLILIHHHLPRRRQPSRKRGECVGKVLKGMYFFNK
jgi:hypothetical protein